MGKQESYYINVAMTWKDLPILHCIKAGYDFVKTITFHTLHRCNRSTRLLLESFRIWLVEIGSDKKQKENNLKSSMNL